MNRFVFTCGDPNGIGTEIVIKTLNKVFNSKSEFIFICPQKIFNHYISKTKPKFSYKFYTDTSQLTSVIDHVKIIDIKGGKLSIGKASKASGEISYRALQEGLELCNQKNSSAIITAPISKKAWELNNIRYEGHTDYLGEYFNIANPLMLFYSKKLIAALSTIHIPISKVSKSLTKSKLSSLIQSLNESLKVDFQIQKPKIAVLGLNPHSGEEGKIGKEEINIISPVVNKYSKNVFGPFVPDAFFGKKLYKNYDCVLGMYHDQVLIPFKMLDFEKGVNFTANLPIVRTSPDHGTAYDIAGKGIADPGSMIEAFKLAKKVLGNRQRK